ncbi:MAG: hypothetical protein JWO31_1720 [Phycisphaerales bacterium]|nr:hypothetical protein [Phycisphaerales bacterium]
MAPTPGYKLAAVTLVALTLLAAAAVGLLIALRRGAARRARGRGDPDYDPYSASPVPYGPAACDRCGAALPGNARYCPGCGIGLAGR